ncbi:MAG TPA: hypothetical protein VFH68_20455 [Polyangia bacterium]|jgi:hypothetical protein|nr:hypothetical protein [Polyangia bacterium]
MVTARAARVWRALIKDRETGWGFAGVVAAVYLAFLIWMHLHHEIWRDEAHAWSLARIAQGFGDLVTGDRRYEGHPPLWFWYLRVWSWIVPAAWGLQVATIAAALGAALLWLRFAPFPRVLKVLLLATYYFGYEYTVMCRNYVLGWLFLCVFCTLYHPLRLRVLTLTAVLVLLAWTSVYGLILAIGLVLFLALEQVRLRGQPPPRQLVAVALPRQLLGAGVFALAVWFFAWTVEPPDPNPFSPGWNFNALNRDALPQVVVRVLDGMLPLRPFRIDFWHRVSAYWDRAPEAMPYVATASLTAAAAVLYRSWRLVCFYVVSVVLMVVVQVARYGGSPRHWGHFFMAFVAAGWVLRTLAPRRRHLPSLVLLLVLCGMQVQSFLAATVADTRFPFSGGRDAAAFIRRAGMRDWPLVAGPGQALTVAVYLRRPFYNMETEEVEETVAFHTRRKNFSASELVQRAIGVSREQRRPVVVVTGVPLAPVPPGVRAQLLYSSRPCTIDDEQFRVYSLDAS